METIVVGLLSWAIETPSRPLLLILTAAAFMKLVQVFS